MRPNLSIENLTAVLAALGTSAIVACGGNEPQPVHANEVPGTAAPAGSGMASCSAKGCGGKAADTTAPATAPATSPAMGAAATTTPAATADVAASTSAAPAASAAPSKAPAKSTAKKATGTPKASGEASCGAGTCSGDSKKKIL
jgi:hypothetical protein